MIQPKHSPKEALEKIKLMMKYDTSKTLNENKQVISEDVDWGRAGTTAGVTAGSAGVGALAVATPLATTAAGASVLTGVSNALGVGVFAAGGIVAGAAALALTPLIYWLVTKDNARSKVTKALNYCKTESVKIAKLERGVDDRTIRALSVDLHDAMEGIGTDEQKITDSFRSLKTASDLCALVDRFNLDWSDEDGDLMEWLDSDIDTDTDWNKIYIPIRDVVEDSLLSIKDEKTEEDCKANPKQPKCGGGIVPPNPNPNKTSKFTPCSGTYRIKCSSNVIAKVQGCLGGLVQDGKFGPRTQEALKSKGYPNGFTDADVSKICKVSPVEPVEPEVGGEELTIDAGNL